MNKYKSMIAAILETASPHLCSEDVTNASTLIDHDEWGEAYLLICTQLYERGNPVPSDLYRIIEEAGGDMRIDQGEWMMLRELVSNE